MGFWRRFWQWWGSLIHQAGGGSEFLCDHCRYNYPSACHRPQRPNATQCPDYKKR